MKAPKKFGAFTFLLYIVLMKKLIALLLLANIGYGQYCPALGPDQLLPCGVGSTTLTADLSQCGPGTNPNQTTNYTVGNIPYVSQTNTGIQLFMTDDSQQGPFNIGFNFCFFGQTYTQFWIGSNGWVSFSPGQPNTFTTQTIPTGNALVPKNCIMGPWQDWHPGIGGQIRYQTVGVAPCRKLIVSWTNVPMYSCTLNQGTFHIVIYESSNYIENYIQNKPACLQWQNGTATQGIHNNPGTVGIAVPGRNSSAWITTNDAWRWTPSGPTVTPVLTWYQVGNPVAIGTGPTINVTPPAGGAQYTCKFVYPICNAGWSSCNAGGSLGPDTVLVVPGPPNLPQPTVFSFNPTCNGDCNGFINITPNGGTGIQTISWNGPPTGFTPTGLCAGIYPFTITDAAGCIVSSTVTLTNPPIPTISPIIYSDTACYDSPNEIYSVVQQPGYLYQWSSIGFINSGQGNDSISVDWSGFTAGFIPGAVMVTGFNQNNCPSFPETIDLTIFNIIPVIDPAGPFCSNDEFSTLNALPVGGVFSGTGITGNDFYPSNADTLDNYVIYTYNQSGCSFDDTINIIVYEQPQISQITPYNDFFELCDGDSIPSTYSVISTLSGGYNEWTLSGNTTQSTNFNIAWDAFGMFPLSVVNYVNGCPSPQQQTVITITQCPNLLFYIPNSFTPDGDEHNNDFKWIFTSGFDPYNFHIEIYNRWGEIIYESNNSLDYWDGTYANIPCPSGLYNYRVYFKSQKDDGRYEFVGNVNLIR
jgi:gliding motility-associated-like protein